MRTIVLLLVVVVLVGCLDWQPNQTHHYSLYIDPQFTSTQSAAIIAGATDWETKSGSFITFDEAGVENGSDTISIYAVSNIQADCDPGAVGCQETEGVDSNIYLPITGDDSYFQQVATHEVGHALGCNHIAAGNIMCADRGCAALTVQCGDIQEMCSHWAFCDATTMPGCSP
jgi:hypothetical protein